MCWKPTDPGLFKLLPADLGDQRLVAAATVVTVAADEARARSVAETVSRLQRLIPGGHRHDLAGEVRQLRARGASSAEPALWAWNAEGWEELLLWWWSRSRSHGGDISEDVAEWRARWSTDRPWADGIDRPERAPRRHGRTLVTPFEFFAHEPEPLRLLAQAVLKDPRTAAAVEDSVRLRDEHLQDAGHLRWLAEQQAAVEQLENWSRKQQATGSEATRAFLAELSESAKRYTSLVRQPVVDALSGCERALLSDSRHGSRRTAADYLQAFLDWQVEPAEDTWQDDDALSAETVRQAREHHERGETTWHGMRGTIPVWYRIVTSAQEKAAALAYSGRPSPSVVRVRTGAEEPSSGLGLFDDPWGEPGESTEWYPEPGIEIHYAQDDVYDLCALLAVAQLGHARLEFLVVRPDGRVQHLRSVRAGVLEDNATSWRRWALTALADLAPDPEDLADLMARDEGEDIGDADTDIASDEPPSTAPRSSAAGRALSPELLSKVRALLRKAENDGATEDEARAFLNKALELMAKYGIERAMLDDLDESTRPTDKLVDVHPPYAKEVRRLFGRIAWEMRCQVVYLDGKDNMRRIHLFGYETDIQATEVLFASLRLQMLAGANRADRLYRPVGEDARAYKRSWMLGFIREVSKRIGAAQHSASSVAEENVTAQGAEANGRSVALVLADRSAVVEARLNERYPKLGKVRPTKFKGSGYWQGVADGRRADIGREKSVDGEANAELDR